MLVKANLYISDSGSLRITKTDFAPRSDELAVRLNIDVPDSFWKRPTPVAKLSIPEDFMVQPTNEMAIEWAAPEIAEALRLEVTDVKDGLTVLMQKKIKDEADA